ncbi:hypothetical protein BC826DRAFT_1189424 [Russula brevipes]|nr:hypothetical protein BC826DRAFT_1189424 [Russula brevipes]
MTMDGQPTSSSVLNNAGVNIFLGWHATLLVYHNISPIFQKALPMSRRTVHNPSLGELDDDSLLNIFYLYRLALLNQNREQLRNEQTDIWDTTWDYERWRYNLAHVCQRWRCLVLGSASYLRLFLVCPPGAPVTDMLAHSPPLPLMIKHIFRGHYITAKDEEGINLALGYRDRVRRIGLFRIGMYETTVSLPL